VLTSAVFAGLLAPACVRDNPAFDSPEETVGGNGEVDPSSGDTNPQTSGVPDESEDEEGLLLCDLAGGIDMTIKVPQPCGETNDVLDTYEHWFNVVEASGSDWQVQFCTAECGECEPLAFELTFAPLSVADLAGPDTCLRMAARRLGEGDDCDYQAATVQNMSNNGEVLIVARRTELLEVPELASNTGLLGFAPSLVLAETCDCSETPDSCCDGQAPILYAYEVGGIQIPVGEAAAVNIGGREFEFWAFDAFSSGDCGAETRVVWALTAG
jgi:hypothetical protein